MASVVDFNSCGFSFEDVDLVSCIGEDVESTIIDFDNVDEFADKLLAIEDVEELILPPVVVPPQVKEETVSEVKTPITQTKINYFGEDDAYISTFSKKLCIDSDCWPTREISQEHVCGNDPYLGVKDFVDVGRPDESEYMLEDVFDDNHFNKQPVTKEFSAWEYKLKKGDGIVYPLLGSEQIAYSKSLAVIQTDSSGTTTDGVSDNTDIEEVPDSSHSNEQCGYSSSDVSDPSPSSSPTRMYGRCVSGKIGPSSVINTTQVCPSVCNSDTNDTLPDTSQTTISATAKDVSDPSPSSSPIRMYGQRVSGKKGPSTVINTTQEYPSVCNSDTKDTLPDTSQTTISATAKDCPDSKVDIETTPPSPPSNVLHELVSSNTTPDLSRSNTTTRQQDLPSTSSKISVLQPITSRYTSVITEPLKLTLLRSGSESENIERNKSIIGKKRKYHKDKQSKRGSRTHTAISPAYCPPSIFANFHDYAKNPCLYEPTETAKPTIVTIKDHSSKENSKCRKLDTKDLTCKDKQKCRKLNTQDLTCKEILKCRKLNTQDLTCKGKQKCRKLDTQELLGKGKQKCRKLDTQELLGKGKQKCRKLDTQDLTEKVKQDHHNQLERDRRQKLANLFTELRDKVPGVSQQANASKATILDQATSYIRDLQKLDQQQEETLTKENKRNKELRKQLEQLTAQNSQK